MATTSPPLPVESYDLANSQDGLDLANELAKFIKDNKLTSQVQGKDFVNVEAWQYAGYRLGIVPVVGKVVNISTGDEVKYRADVKLLDLRRGVVVGGGTGVCSNKESGKKFYQEFAIAGMAQTRATGRALRNVLAWLIRAAGYEPTPAEEMEYEQGKAGAAFPLAAPLDASREKYMAVFLEQLKVIATAEALTAFMMEARQESDQEMLAFKIASVKTAAKSLGFRSTATGYVAADATNVEVNKKRGSAATQEALDKLTK